MRCTYARHRDFVARDLTCPECRIRNKKAARKEAVIATAGMGKALGDFVRHAWAWLRMQVLDK